MSVEAPVMSAIIGGKRYDTATATLIAHNRYFDGSNWERSGRNTYLFKTPKGAYFVLHYTLWQGERSSIDVLEPEAAMSLYEHLPEHEASYFEAFGVEPEEA